MDKKNCNIDNKQFPNKINNRLKTVTLSCQYWITSVNITQIKLL